MAIRAMGPSGQYETGLDAAGAALPELLAPAGGLDQMLAAIAAGAMPSMRGWAALTPA